MKKQKLVALLEENARLSLEQLAAAAALSVAEVADYMDELENSGIIRGYRAVVDHQKLGDEFITSLIELKVTPKKDYGFEEIAKTIMEFPEVESVYLMSGGFDLAVTVSGKNFTEVATFVSHRLAPLDSVVSTATHFVLRKYKENGVSMLDPEKDERGKA